MANSFVVPARCEVVSCGETRRWGFSKFPRQSKRSTVIKIFYLSHIHTYKYNCKICWLVINENCHLAFYLRVGFMYKMRVQGEFSFKCF